MSALHDAVFRRDRTKLVKLINAGADLEVVNGEGRTPLFSAVSSRFIEGVQILLVAGANPNTASTHWNSHRDDSSLLIFAATISDSNGPIIKLLIDAGADVNYRRSIHLDKRDDCSALDVAILSHYWEFVRILVDAGADLTAPTYLFGQLHDRPPLIDTITFNQADLAELMIEYGADVHAVSTKYRGFDIYVTPLHIASYKKSSRIVRLLCDAGADINAIAWADKRYSPLRLAVTKRFLANVSTLLAAGADVWTVHPDGKTAMDETASPTLQVLLDSRPSVFD